MVNLRRVIGDELEHVELDDNFAVQYSHSNTFSVGDLVYPDTLTTWAKAQADAEASLAVGVIVDVSGDDFSVLTLDGMWYTSTSHGFAVTAKLYLSTSSAGDLTATEPTSGFIQPVGSVIDANTLVFRLGFIGEPA